MFEGFASDVTGELHSTAHKRDLKVWYDDATREHYEAQLIRIDGGVALEVGFHAEYPKVGENEAVLARLLDAAIEIAARLADYVTVLEPLRRRA